MFILWPRKRCCCCVFYCFRSLIFSQRVSAEQEGVSNRGCCALCSSFLCLCCSFFTFFFSFNCLQVNSIALGESKQASNAIDCLSWNLYAQQLVACCVSPTIIGDTSKRVTLITVAIKLEKASWQPQHKQDNYNFLRSGQRERERERETLGHTLRELIGHTGAIKVCPTNDHMSHTHTHTSKTIKKTTNSCFHEWLTRWIDEHAHTGHAAGDLHTLTVNTWSLSLHKASVSRLRLRLTPRQHKSAPCGVCGHCKTGLKRDTQRKRVNAQKQWALDPWPRCVSKNNTKTMELALHSSTIYY